MGTIATRDDNQGKTTYQAKIRRVGFPVMSKTFPTKAAAKKWMMEQENAMLYGPYMDTQAASTRTLGELLDRYLEEITPYKAGADVEEYRIRVLRKSKLAKMIAGKVDSTHIQQYVKERSKTVGSSSINRELAVLSNVFNVAKRSWKIGLAGNPVADVVRPKDPVGRDRRLSPAEEVRLLAECSKTRGGYLRALVELALETAMRESELIALEWQNVDFSRRTIHVLKSKNGESRGVPMSRRAIEVLRAIEPKNLPGIEPTGRVFPGLTYIAAHNAFIRTCKRAGIEDLHFHDLRHEAISRFAELRRLSVPEIASITGHKNFRILQRYMHLNAEKLAPLLDE